METKAVKENNGMTTEQKIEQWKAKYKNIFAYEVENDKGETVTAYLRSPDRKVVSAAAMNSKGDPNKYNELILKNCLLESDSDLLADDSTFFGLSQKVDELVGAKVGELKKL